MTKQAIEAANRLAEVLAQENAALKRMDFHTAIALVPAKEAALAEVTKDGLLSPAASRFPGFPASAQRLRGLAEENRVLLERAIAVQTRILGIVARSIAPVREGPRYQRPHDRKTPHRALAMAVSKRV